MEQLLENCSTATVQRCESGWKIFAGNEKILGKHSQTAMKFYYLCRVDEKMELSAQGGKKLFSGAPEFSLCPARKNEVNSDSNH